MASERTSPDRCSQGCLATLHRRRIGLDWFELCAIESVRTYATHQSPRLGPYEPPRQPPVQPVRPTPRSSTTQAILHQHGKLPLPHKEGGRRSEPDAVFAETPKVLTRKVRLEVSAISRSQRPFSAIPTLRWRRRRTQPESRSGDV
jgi:hypothetical protein